MPTVKLITQAIIGTTAIAAYQYGALTANSELRAQNQSLKGELDVRENTHQTAMRQLISEKDTKINELHQKLMEKETQIQSLQGEVLKQHLEHNKERKWFWN
jgi:uncharacterized protein HemX